MSKDKLDGFEFKQFAIEHKHCAMKVGTDSIMLGSWVDMHGAKRVLDIGCGSGLLAIMLAQKAEPQARIIGVDINADAIKQAKLNALRCPWADSLHFILGDIAEFKAASCFDLILSNPPYFAPPQRPTNAYKGENLARQQARLTSSLGVELLMGAVSRLLAPGGRFFCVLPVEAAASLKQAATVHQLNIQKLMQVRNKASAKVIRQLYQFSRTTEVQVQQQQLVIRNNDNSYSDDYIDLCRDYYLNF